jgi:hypothetical protein
MERMMIVEDHSAFAQSLGLVLGEGTRISLARTLDEGRALLRPASLSTWWCSTSRFPTEKGPSLYPRSGTATPKRASPS